MDEDNVHCHTLQPTPYGFVRSYSSNQLHATERRLEQEIRRESCYPPKEYKLARFRRRCEHVLHGKYVLLAIVILNLIDCALVLGELILDIHHLKEMRSETELSNQKFVNRMQKLYPSQLLGHDINNMQRLYDQIYLADCQWPDRVHAADNIGNVSFHRNGSTHRVKHSSETLLHQYSPLYSEQAKVTSNKAYNNSEQLVTYNTMDANDTHKIDKDKSHADNSSQDRMDIEVHLKGHDEEHLKGDGHAHSQEHHGGQHGHSIWDEITHGMHTASIVILGILFVENICKVICMGQEFFKKKLEIFDAVIVIVSFVVDLVLAKGPWAYKVQTAVFILSFLLPWRVIRVVNSLIVAVLDQEHFRLKMLYQEKKAIAEELRIYKDTSKRWDFHLKKIETFCESEGIPKWKIRQHTAMARKQSTITSMASLALNGFLQGMLLSPDDKRVFDKAISLSSPKSTPDIKVTVSAAGLQAIDETESDDFDEDEQKLYISESENDLQADTVPVKRHSHDSNIHKPLKKVSFDAQESRPLLPSANLANDSMHDTKLLADMKDIEYADNDASAH